MQVEQRVRALVEEKISDRPDLFIVSIQMAKNGLLSILVDGDSGLAIEDCAMISRHVGYHLEEENVIETAYRLEVSSPGIDAPLVELRQYTKNIGRNVRITLSDGQRHEGTLREAEAAQIILDESVKEKGKKARVEARVVLFADIKETKVLISFK